jgi:nucleotide-binding universal stress UspA family protein
VFRNVLLALDFSAAADRALTEAVALGERHGGRLTILTAIPEVRGWAAGPVESVTAANELNAQLEREACRLQQRALERVPDDLPVKTVIRREAACKALLQELSCGCYDTLVLGASGAGRVRLTRSLTRQLMRKAGVPVLVVGDEGVPPKLHVPKGAEETPAVPVVPPSSDLRPAT